MTIKILGMSSMPLSRDLWKIKCVCGSDICCAFHLFLFLTCISHLRSNTLIHYDHNIQGKPLCDARFLIQYELER